LSVQQINVFDILVKVVTSLATGIVCFHIVLAMLLYDHQIWFVCFMARDVHYQSGLL